LLVHSFLFSLCLREIRGWIPPQVCLEESLGFRQRKMVITLSLDLEAQIRSAALQKMPPAGSVI
jgi:hypothetical protein